MKLSLIRQYHHRIYPDLSFVRWPYWLLKRISYHLLLSGQNSAPLFIAPSVTPWRYVIPNKIGPAHNPGIRLVEYDRTTGINTDIKQYYLDLTKANKDGVADWELEYTFSSVYGTKSLTGHTIESVVNEMKQSRNGQKLNKFWKHFTVSPPDDLLEPCTDDCRLSILCGFTKYDMSSFDSCKTDLVSGSSSMFIPMSGFVSVVIYVFNFLLCWFMTQCFRWFCLCLSFCNTVVHASFL